MYRIIAVIIGDIARIEDLSGSVRMRRDDGEDDVLLFVKSRTRRPFGVATFTRTTPPFHKMPNATLIGLLPTGTIGRKKGVTSY